MAPVSLQAPELSLLMLVREDTHQGNRNAPGQQFNAEKLPHNQSPDLLTILYGHFAFK